VRVLRVCDVDGKGSVMVHDEVGCGELVCEQMDDWDLDHD